MMLAPQRRKNRSIVSVAHFTDFFNRKKTFRPRKRFAPGTMRHCLHKRAERSMLSSVDLDSVVKLPPGETLEDWIAVHTIQVYDYCTPNTCPVMNGGPRYEYYWMDGKNYRKPTALPASRYIELVLEWIETAINDETQFPTSTDVPFPSHFHALSQKIFSRLYRVFVHIFIHHYEVLVYLNAEAPVLTCYRHFYRFVTQFELITERELSPLMSFSAKVCAVAPTSDDENDTSTSNRTSVEHSAFSSNTHMQTSTVEKSASVNNVMKSGQQYSSNTSYNASLPHTTQQQSRSIDVETKKSSRNITNENYKAAQPVEYCCPIASPTKIKLASNVNVRDLFSDHRYK